MNSLVIGISNEDYLARGESVIINCGILFIHVIWIRQDTNRKKMQELRQDSLRL